MSELLCPWVRLSWDFPPSFVPHSGQALEEALRAFLHWGAPRMGVFLPELCFGVRLFFLSQRCGSPGSVGVAAVVEYLTGACLEGFPPSSAPNVMPKGSGQGGGQ